mgnify:CR=1 FL=1
MALTESEKESLRLMLNIPNLEKLRYYAAKSDEEIRAELTTWKAKILPILEKQKDTKK